MKKFFAVLLFLISLCGYSYADGQSVTNNQRELTMQVDEMNCQLCVYLVNKELRSIEGVLKTKADMNAHTVKVITTDKVSNEQLIKVMEKLHYHAKVL
ncbi:heavy-metal-associated domain-containing protein [Gallibacterium anatis]|uniref:heavy-metal-associated domain-containing protein n=1 Tax=Gallibacterium anatis TaxID=750 RepID=UPI000531F9DD|nr:heavy-metal-associated domain-containing protein [Gallibacterium anatis]KGQ28417.1 mercuric reductase [Gallibacterium anatis]